MLLFCFLPPPTTLLLLPITTKTRVQWLRRGARRLPLLPYRGQLRKKDPHTKQTEKRRKINDPIRICHRLSASGRTEKGLQTAVDILLTISEGAQRHLSCLKKNTKKVFYRQEYVAATATYWFLYDYMLYDTTYMYYAWQTWPESSFDGCYYGSVKWIVTKRDREMYLLTKGMIY